MSEDKKRKNGDQDYTGRIMKAGDKRELERPAERLSKTKRIDELKDK